jgi:PAS domain S-box-containing protein
VHRRRSLRQRALWSIGIAISLLAAGLYGVSRWVILNGFEKLEREETRQSLSRVNDAIQNDLAEMSRNAAQYSAWDQTYTYAHTGDPQFVKSELPDATFASLKINFIVLLDPHGRVLFRKGYDWDRSAAAPVPPDLLRQLTPTFALGHIASLGDTKSGIVVLSEGPALVVSQPILTSDNRGPVAGTFVMGRWLDAQELSRLSAVTHIDMTVAVLKDRSASAQAERHLSEGPEQWIHVLDDHTIAGDQYLDDISGKPAILVTVNIPRTIYQQGRLSLVQFIILLLAASAMFTAVMLGVLERLVLNRLAKLSGDVADIGAGADFAARVEVEGADELSKLGSSINRMLEALERSQQARAEQSARLRMMIERMPALLWTTDLDLRFISVMGAGLQALDLKPNELAGVSIFDYFGTRDTSFEPVAAHFRALNGHALSYETKWHDRLLQCHVEPMRDVNDAIVGVIGIALDGTEHALVQEALRESETSYQSLIEEAPYGICRCNVGGSFTLVNHALVRMLGFPSEQELLGQNIGVDVFDDLQDHASFVSRLQAEGSADGVEAQWKRFDGKAITVHLAGRAVRDASGQIAYFEIMAEDVSERKQLELQLRQSQKMQAIGQLAGGVAHDFNNLLMVVKGHLELVLAGMTPSDPLYPRLDQIQKAAQRASSLTRQLLAFSRLQVLQPQVLDLNNIVSGMIQMLSRLIGENIDLVFRPGGILGRVKADAGQMEQVLLNLVVNARDAMPAGGTLTIETSNVELDQSYAQLHSIVKPGPYVMLAVSDTGIGIDQATQARIFEPFFTTKEPGKGTGLGLSTVYGVIKQSDGYIWVYSEPGQGTTFKIYLPLATDAVEASKSAPPAPASVNGSETILLVEDEESVRSLVRDFLLANGHTVLEAGDGPDAIRIAETHGGTIDLLISDVIMPQTSGRELSVEIKKRLPDVKVLFISGYTDDSVVRHGIIEGEVAFLQKPFTMKALAAKVREILDDESVREYSNPPQS